MTENEYAILFSEEMLNKKLSLEKEGVADFNAYFIGILEFIDSEIKKGRRDIRIDSSIYDVLKGQATRSVEQLYTGSKLREGDQFFLISSLVDTLNNRIASQAQVINGVTNRQIAVAVKRALDTLGDTFTAEQLSILVRKHLSPIWGRRASNMVVSETQMNVETINHVNNKVAEQQAYKYLFLGDDTQLQLQLESSTVFSYLALAEELGTTTRDKRYEVIAQRRKQWFTMADEKVRASHAAVHGQILPEAESFTVGASQLMYPGDPSGEVEEIINCRCVLVYL